MNETRGIEALGSRVELTGGRKTRREPAGFCLIDFLPVMVLLWPIGKGEEAKEWETPATG